MAIDLQDRVQSLEAEVAALKARLDGPSLSASGFKVVDKRGQVRAELGTFTDGDGAEWPMFQLFREPEVAAVTILAFGPTADPHTMMDIGGRVSLGVNDAQSSIFISEPAPGYRPGGPRQHLNKLLISLSASPSQDPTIRIATGNGEKAVSLSASRFLLTGQGFWERLRFWLSAFFHRHYP